VPEERPPVCVAHAHQRVDHLTLLGLAVVQHVVREAAGGAPGVFRRGRLRRLVGGGRGAGTRRLVGGYVAGTLRFV
jgi:hypothetical protein